MNFIYGNAKLVIPRHIFPDSDITRPGCSAVLQHQDDLYLKPVIRIAENIQNAYISAIKLDDADLQ